MEMLDAVVAWFDGPPTWWHLALAWLICGLVIAVVFGFIVRAAERKEGDRG